MTQFVAARWQPGRVHAAGAVCLLAYAALAFFAHSGSAGLTALWVAGGIAWLALIASLPSVSAARPGAVLGWAVAFHLAGVLGGPFLEDDFHRYLWDGYRFAVDGTPYAAAPSAFFADASVPPVLRAHLDSIAYPDLPTIYGPLTEWLFRAAYAFAPGQLWPLQVMLSAINLGAIVLFTTLPVTPTARLLYSWNPLVIIETAFMGHPDILAAGLALAAWLAQRRGRSAAAGALLAAACASRLVFVLAAPLILARAGWRGWAACLLVLAAAYGPFLSGGATEAPVLLAFGERWQFNAGLFALIGNALGDQAARIMVSAAAAALVLALLPQFRRMPLDQSMSRAVVLVLALPLLLGPVVNAWYLIWLLPLAVLNQLRLAPWLASAALLLSYGTRFNLGGAPIEDYQHPGWLLALEHGLIWVGVVCEALYLGGATSMPGWHGCWRPGQKAA